MSTPVLSARGQLGRAQQQGDPDQIQTARRNLAAAKIESYIQRVVSDAPPLSAEQRDRLAAIIRGAA
jgi:hypothetical protein